MSRREFNVFNLSFLDCICCGFGAVLLLFVMVNSRGEGAPVEAEPIVEVPEPSFVPDLSSEVNRLKDQVLQGRKNLVLARNTMEETVDELARTEGLSREVIDTLEQKKIELAEYEKDTIARTEHINKLKADVRALQQDNKRLEGGAQQVVETGSKVRQFVGDGQRQYLTGLKVGGNRILILLDSSNSMLGEKLVDVLVRRNLSDTDKVRSPKWRQAMRTVEWVAAQFPRDSQFQIYHFNETAQAVLTGTDGKWLRSGDPKQLNEAVFNTKRLVPKGGTSLQNAFKAARELQPAPDNIYLLTDGLPTMRERKGFKKRVTSKERFTYFNVAVGTAPRGVPINTILYPMEGDPLAAGAFWSLALKTNGSFITPSSDWP